MVDPYIEVRGDFLREHVDVIDAVVQATPGASRTAVLRAIVADWVERKVHEAILVQRVARHNGIAPAPERHASGNAAAPERHPEGSGAAR